MQYVLNFIGITRCRAITLYNIYIHISFDLLANRRSKLAHFHPHYYCVAATNIVAFKLDASFPLAGLLSRRDRYIEN